jgi:hypothetical protein
MDLILLCGTTRTRLDFDARHLNMAANTKL